MHLTSPLDDRSSWRAADRCPIENAMKILGSRNAMLILREAFYGTTRFDSFAELVGMSAATTAANMKHLTAAGLFERRPYRAEGSRTRYEYVLTAAGSELMPILVGLFEWGTKYAGHPPGVESVHRGCGAPIDAEVRCESGHRLASDDDIELRPVRGATGRPR